MSPKEIIDNSLIPAIRKVGELYEEKKYFLPQLIRGAEAMERAMEALAPYLDKEAYADIGKKGTVVMATVKGDIHDIGKNIVVLLLRNHGFEVVDLGKDVPADRIIQAAKDNNADIIGLSALMTTTMTEMPKVAYTLCRVKGGSWWRAVPDRNTRELRRLLREGCLFHGETGRVPVWIWAAADGNNPSGGGFQPESKAGRI